MTYPQGFDIARGLAGGHESIHKFGRNTAVGTSYVPVSEGGAYQLLQPANAVQLRVKAGGNAGDTDGGLGAWEVMLSGINPLGEKVEELLTLAGASASAPTVNTYIRLFRVRVTKSGFYGADGVGSHLGNIVIEDVGGVADWATIPFNGFAQGTSQIAAWAAEKGKTAYFLGFSIQLEANKPMDILFVRRADVLDAVPPYKPVIVQLELIGLETNYGIKFESPIKIPELTEVGVLAKVAQGTAAVSVDIEFTMVDGAE